MAKAKSNELSVKIPEGHRFFTELPNPYGLSAHWHNQRIEDGCWVMDVDEHIDVAEDQCLAASIVEAIALEV